MQTVIDVNKEISSDSFKNKITKKLLTYKYVKSFNCFVLKWLVSIILWINWQYKYITKLLLKIQQWNVYYSSKSKWISVRIGPFCDAG